MYLDDELLKKFNTKKEFSDFVDKMIHIKNPKIGVSMCEENIAKVTITGNMSLEEIQILMEKFEREGIIIW